jgi:hypothetical protein
VTGIGWPVLSAEWLAALRFISADNTGQPM